METTTRIPSLASSYKKLGGGGEMPLNKDGCLAENLKRQGNKVRTHRRVITAWPWGVTTGLQDRKGGRFDIGLFSWPHTSSVAQLTGVLRAVAFKHVGSFHSRKYSVYYVPAQTLRKLWKWLKEEFIKWTHIFYFQSTPSVHFIFHFMKLFFLRIF